MILFLVTVWCCLPGNDLLSCLFNWLRLVPDWFRPVLSNAYCFPRGGTLRKLPHHEHSIFHVKGGHIRPTSRTRNRGVKTELIWVSAIGVHFGLLHEVHKG